MQIIPAANACSLCAGTAVDAAGACISRLCSSEEMRLVRTTADTGALSPNALHILQNFVLDIDEDAVAPPREVTKERKQKPKLPSQAPARKRQKVQAATMDNLCTF